MWWWIIARASRLRLRRKAGIIYRPVTERWRRRGIGRGMVGMVGNKGASLTPSIPKPSATTSVVPSGASSTSLTIRTVPVLWRPRRNSWLRWLLLLRRGRRRGRKWESLGAHCGKISASPRMSDSIDAILSHHPRDLRKPPITSDLFFRTKALKLLFRSETRTVIALTVKWRSHVLTSGYQVEEEKN